MLLVKEGLNNELIARLCHCSASSVRRTIIERIKTKYRVHVLPKHLFFDEFRSVKNMVSFICCDAQTHKLVVKLPDRLSATIINYFENRYSKQERDQVESVVVDLNAQYQRFIRQLFPNAKIIIDRFHVVQLVGCALNSMRTDLMNRFEHSSKNYKLFKRNCKLFLKRYDDLNCTHQFYERAQRKWVTSEQLVNQGLQLADQDFRKAYWDYQRLLEVIAEPAPSKIKIFKQCLIEVNQKYSGSRHKASKADKTLLTLYDNLIPVITALETKYCHYTNGPLEGINRKIKQIQRILPMVIIILNTSKLGSIFRHILVKIQEAP